ncbi:cysteine desulfurase [Sphingobium sp. B2D3A]|nr:cysteine desulfurase [Sphingobium sp. B2D3A]
MVAAMDHYGNPNSAHRIGRIAAADVELARGRILDALGRADGRLIFTSGATEALNMAIIGAARAAPQSRRRVVTVATEHAAVLDTVMALRREGFEPVIVPVNADGLVDLEIAEAAIDERAALLAVMQVNNEIGVVQPLDRLFVIARAAGVPTLCDAVQGFGRRATPQADLIAISAHKIHGPKGVGALWLREGLDLPPLMHGGGQEQGVRAGDALAPCCARASVWPRNWRRSAAMPTSPMSKRSGRARWSCFADWHLNGTGEARYHGNLNLRRPGLDAARLISDVRTVAVSLGSACASGSAGRAMCSRPWV